MILKVVQAGKRKHSSDLRSWWSIVWSINVENGFANRQGVSGGQRLGAELGIEEEECPAISVWYSKSEAFGRCTTVRV